MIKLIWPLVVASWTCCAASSQGRTWIVDAQNGTGTHFVDLPQAVAAVADGDILIVRSGTYTGFSTNKALAILGDSSRPTVVNAVGNGATIEVANLPRGRAFVIHSCVVRFSFFRGLSLSNNQGQIHLHQVVVDGQSFPFAGTYSEGIVAANNELVTITDCDIEGRPPIQAQSSTVTIERTLVRGFDAYYAPHFCPPASSGIDAFSSTLYLNLATVTGGNGASTPCGAVSPLPAIAATQCTLWVRGGGAVIAAGRDLAATGFGIPAIAAWASDVTYDPATPLRSVNGAPPVLGAQSVRAVSLIGVHARGPVLGFVECTVMSPAGDPYVLLVGLPAAPATTPWGKLFVDLQAPWSPAFAVQGATGVTSFRLADPVLLGVPVLFQAMGYFVSRGELSLSNPATVILR